MVLCPGRRDGEFRKHRLIETANCRRHSCSKFMQQKSDVRPACPRSGVPPCKFTFPISARPPCPSVRPPGTRLCAGGPWQPCSNGQGLETWPAGPTVQHSMCAVLSRPAGVGRPGSALSRPILRSPARGPCWSFTPSTGPAPTRRSANVGPCRSSGS